MLHLEPSYTIKSPWFSSRVEGSPSQGADGTGHSIGYGGLDVGLDIGLDVGLDTVERSPIPSPVHPSCRQPL